MIIKEITTPTPAHWQLFCRADPNPDLVQTYLTRGKAFEVRNTEQELCAVMILVTNSDSQLEIKNIAVDPRYENHGIATRLLKFACQYAHQSHYPELIIATGSTSFKQLYLYQKFGFRIIKINPDFFVKNYPHPIYENHLRLRDLLILKLKLN